MHGTDVRAVATIEASAFSDPWPAEAFDSLIGRPHARLQVAVDAEGTILGYCVVIRALDEGEVANIATSTAARGCGVGGALLDEALAHGDATGVASMFLEVRVSNDAARGLYESRGFRPVGRRRGYYQRPDEDALVLRRDAPAGAGAGPGR
ncbi:MAG: ribosomal protein S18-alanine N-acetyltransferase [Gemmatimonadaceae bacterium]|nr:ribosomal protein S18-alanine N-acetyltransferase [Gemmatimonadaceae bacterium]